MLVTLPPANVSPDQKRQILERVLASRTFSRSDQLRRFLRYVCEKEIAGRASEINEYSVAVDALGRGANYSPADDSSVRTRAHALRQKLHEYYEVEESEAAVRIDIAKGSYYPHFLLREPDLDNGLEVVAEPEAARPRNLGLALPMPFFAGSVATAFILILAFLFARRFESRTHVEPVLQEAWGRILTPGQTVDVYIASPPAMLLHSYREGLLPSHPGPLLPAPGEVSSWYDTLQMKDGGGKLYMHTTQDVFLFGDSLAATAAAQLISGSGALPKIMPEAKSQAFALRDRNVVLIGSPNYSPLAARFLAKVPFSVRYDSATREEVVSDLEGKHVFRPTTDESGMMTKAYGIVTVLPSQNSAEERTQIVILSGITSAGPQAALEFFKSPQALRGLKARFRREGQDGFPPAYQVVVRCGMDHNLALTWEYATHQTIRYSPLLQ